MNQHEKLGKDLRATLLAVIAGERFAPGDPRRDHVLILYDLGLVGDHNISGPTGGGWCESSSWGDVMPLTGAERDRLCGIRD